MKTTKMVKHYIMLGILTIYSTQVFAGDWAYRGIGGRDEKLCQIMRKRLNQFDRIESPENRCSWNTMVTYSKLTNPPWKELDPKEHKDLLVKLAKYSQEGVAGYFQTMSGLATYPEKNYLRSVENSLQEGIRLQMWKTRLTNYYGQKAAPPGEQTIIQILRKIDTANKKKQCPGIPPAEWSTETFIVTQDLKGPDPAVNSATATALFFSTLKLYEGKPVGILDDAIYKNDEIGFDGYSGYCSFEFVKGEN